MLVGSLGSLHSSCGWEACSWVTKKQWWICNLNPQRARQAASKIATASPRHSMPENREKTRQFTVPQFERSIIALRKLVAETQETQSNSVQIPFHGPWWFFLTFKILIKNRSLRFTAFSPQNSQLVHLINVGRDRIFTGPQIHDWSCINFDVKVAIDTCTKNFQGTVMEEWLPSHHHNHCAPVSLTKRPYWRPAFEGFLAANGGGANQPGQCEPSLVWNQLPEYFQLHIAFYILENEIIVKVPFLGTRARRRM